MVNREFFEFNVNYHLKGGSVSLYNVPANWAKSVSDFFCLNQYLLAYFFSLKIVKCIRKKLNLPYLWISDMKL